MQRLGKEQWTSQLMDRMDLGLMAVLLAGMVGAIQFRVLVSSAAPDRQITLNHPEKDPGLDELPAIPRAGVPINDLRSKNEALPPEPLGWDDQPVHTSVQHRVMPDPAVPAWERRD